MMRLMNMLMLSCRKATELMEKKLHARLRVGEKFQLFLHSSMCDACRTYEKQGHLMDSVLKKRSALSDQSTTDSKTLPEGVKLKILRELDELHKKN
jgi:hypothetical protein